MRARLTGPLLPMFDSQWQQRFNALEAEHQDYLSEALALLAEWDHTCLQNPATLRARLQLLISQLDDKLSEQLGAIQHAEPFAELEAAWLGLRSLTELPVNYQRIEIKLLDISWTELSNDLNSAHALKHTQLYNKIGNRELNTLGGHPFNLVVINHQVSMDIDFDANYDDLYTLELLGQLGANCLCPFILSPDSQFLGGDSADWLSDTQRIGKILEGPDYSGWQQLRRSPGARFLGLALPQLQLRGPYREHRSGFIYSEPNRKQPGLWGSAAFAFASTVMREYNRIGWFGFLKSRWQNLNQGALVNLSGKHYQHSPFAQPKPAVRLFGEIVNFYRQQGFLPLGNSSLTDKYFFAGNNSLWRGSGSDIDQVVCQLQTTLMVCRIAHYLKVQIRDLLGSFRTAAECERHLSLWLDNYCSNVVEGDEKTLSRYPLRKGRLQVSEIEGQQGHYRCDVALQPQYQFDHFFGEVLLTTELGQSSSAEALG